MGPGGTGECRAAQELFHLGFAAGALGDGHRRCPLQPCRQNSSHPPALFLPRFARCRNTAEFNRGDLFVIRYRPLADLLSEGAVQLI